MGGGGLFWDAFQPSQGNLEIAHVARRNRAEGGEIYRLRSLQLEPLWKFTDLNKRQTVEPFLT